MEIYVTFFNAKFMECVMVLKTCMLEGDRFAREWNLISFPKSSTRGCSSWILPCLVSGPVYHPSLLFGGQTLQIRWQIIGWSLTLLLTQGTTEQANLPIWWLHRRDSKRTASL